MDDPFEVLVGRIVREVYVGDEDTVQSYALWFVTDKGVYRIDPEGD